MDTNKVKLVVKKSRCPAYQEGDVICFNGALIDKEKSANLCSMAINAVFPFVYAARKGVVRETPIRCPDCKESVEFVIKVEKQNK